MPHTLRGGRNAPENLTMNIRQQLESVKRRFVSVSIPGGEATLQSLSELERTTIFVEAGNDLPKLHAMLIAYCLVDENKDRVYSDDESDIESILNLDASVTGPIVDAINDHLSAIDVEQAAKN